MVPFSNTLLPCMCGVNGIDDTMYSIPEFHLHIFPKATTIDATASSLIRRIAIPVYAASRLTIRLGPRFGSRKACGAGDGWPHAGFIDVRRVKAHIRGCRCQCQMMRAVVAADDPATQWD